MKRIRRVNLWGMLWCVLVLLPLRQGWAGNTHSGTGDTTIEFRAFWGDAGTSYVHTGCTHGVSGTTSASIAACRAYALDTEAPQQLEYIEDLSPRTVTYTAGAGTYWLIAHASTTDPVSGWTRVSVTHYLWQKNTVQPALPSRATWLLQVTVVGTAITSVNDLRTRAPFTTAALSDNALWSASQHGVACDGTTIDTPAIQRLIVAVHAAGGGTIQLPAGTCRVNTLHLNDNVILQGVGPGTVLSFVAHTTTHNPVIRIGDAGTVSTTPPYPGYGEVTNAAVRQLKIVGNRAVQTGAGDEYSPCIMIWGSRHNTVEYTELTDCQGDGITIGYEPGRSVAADKNIVQYNVLYDFRRHPLAITFGNENVIAFNKASGTFDLELDPGVTSTLKKNIVHGNTGRTGGNTSSDLSISLASLNADVSGYFGNIVSNNVVSNISGQYNLNTIITGNVLVGSDPTQLRLMTLEAFDNSVICNNVFVANTTVATALTHILRTRGGRGLVVCNNVVDNGTVPFADYGNAFAASNAFAHRFEGNVLLGTGTYRVPGEGPERPSEQAVVRLRTNGGSPQTLNVVQLTGSPVMQSACAGTMPLNCGQLAFFLSGTSLGIGFESAAAKWMVEVLRTGEVGAQSEPYFYEMLGGIDEIGSNRILSLLSAPQGGATLPYSLYSFASGGTAGTFFLRITY